MAQAPSPITSPPAQPWQPYDATAGGRPEDQTEPETIYDGSGGSGNDPWPKVQEAGAADSTGKVTGGWSGNGTSDGNVWKQC